MHESTCLRDGCTRSPHTRGYCRSCYVILRSRDELPILKRPSVEERFWSKVLKTDTCWVWTAYRNDGGYGKFGIGRKVVLAHRFAYEQEHGALDHGVVIDHQCRNTCCVRPSHLREATSKLNSEHLASGELRLNNTSGYRGVYRRKNGRWIGKVVHNGQQYWTPVVDSIEVAAEDARQLRIRLFQFNDLDRQVSA